MRNTFFSYKDRRRTDSHVYLITVDVATGVGVPLPDQGGEEHPVRGIARQEHKVWRVARALFGWAFSEEMLERARSAAARLGLDRIRLSAWEAFERCSAPVSGLPNLPEALDLDEAARAGAVWLWRYWYARFVVLGAAPGGGQECTPRLLPERRSVGARAEKDSAPFRAAG